MDYSALKEVQFTPEPCIVCSGSKLNDCHTCYGKGNVRCVACSGSGHGSGHDSKGACIICSGSRELPCTSCSRGHTNCSVCAGTGLRW